MDLRPIPLTSALDTKIQGVVLGSENVTMSENVIECPTTSIYNSMGSNEYEYCYKATYVLCLRHGQALPCTAFPCPPACRTQPHLDSIVNPRRYLAGKRSNGRTKNDATCGSCIISVCKRKPRGRVGILVLPILFWKAVPG
jgi:hypothetical protein